MAVVFTGKFPVLDESDIPTDLRERIRDDWYNAIKGKRAKILDRLLRAIPDTVKYVERIAEPGYEGISEVFNPNWVKYNRVLRKYKAKVTRGKDIWHGRVSSAFAEGGAFEQGIYAKMDTYMNNMVTIWRIVGDKDTIFGPAPKAVLALGGKAKVLEAVKLAKDTVTGTPINIFKPEHATRILSTVDQILIEGLNAILLAKEAELPFDALITDYNAILDSYVKNTAFIKSGIDANNTFCHIEYDAVNDVVQVVVQEATL